MIFGLKRILKSYFFFHFEHEHPHPHTEDISDSTGNPSAFHIISPPSRLAELMNPLWFNKFTTFELRTPALQTTIIGLSAGIFLSWPVFPTWDKRKHC